MALKLRPRPGQGLTTVKCISIPQSKYLQVLGGESRSYVAAGNSKNLLTCIWFGILKSAKSVSGVGAKSTKRALGIHISW